MTKSLKLRKSGDDWAELRTCTHPPADFEGKTVLIESGYSELFVTELKDSLPWDARAWDKEARVWRITPRWQELAERIAMKHYASVWRVEGTEITDLKSGVTQGGLW